MKLLLAFVLCVLTCQLSVSEFTLQFTGNSEVIKELIEPLTLKCSFQILDEQGIEKSTTQTIYIFHETKGFIATLSKDQPIITVGLDTSSASVEGELYCNVSKNSYLQVTWQNPTSSESGKYFCGAHVQNSQQRSESFGRMLTIAVEKPTIDDLFKNIIDLKKQSDKHKRSLHNNEQKWKNIEEEFKKQADKQMQSLHNIEERMNNVEEDLLYNKQNLSTFVVEINKIEADFSSFRTKWKIEIYKALDNQVLKNANSLVFLWQTLEKEDPKMSDSQVESTTLKQYRNSSISTLSILTNPLFFASTRYNNSLYTLSKGGIANTINFSLEICQLLGGYLVEVNTELEFNFLRDFLKNVKSPPTFVYTGGTDEDHEGVWTNRYSQTPMKPFWAPKEPSGSLYQNCQTFWKRYDWYMDDLECVNTPVSDPGFMCEIEE